MVWFTQLVPLPEGVGAKRESGTNPGLSRSGKWGRNPRDALGESLGSGGE